MAGADASDILSHISHKVTMQMNKFPSAEFSPEEVKRALDDIGDLKAPQMDGVPTIFQKHY